MKVKDFSEKDFFQSLKKDWAPAVEQAQRANVTDVELESIAKGIYIEGNDLSYQLAGRRFNKMVLARIEAHNAPVHKGILIGSRDRIGKNSPIRYILVKKDGKHIEVSNFGTQTEGAMGKITIQVPSLVTLRATHDPQYDSWQLKGVDEMAPLPSEKIATALAQIAMKPAEITKEMAYSQGHSAKAIVVYGDLGYIGNEATFRRSEKEDGTSRAEVDSYRPVLVPSEISREMLPCFNFTLRGKGVNRVRCHIEPQRHGRPLVLLPDIQSICKHAYDARPDDPEAQASYLNEWLRDLPIFVVGTVNRFNKAYAQGGNEVNYVDIGVAAVIEAPGEMTDGGFQKTLEPKAAPAPTNPVTGVVHTETPVPETHPVTESEIRDRYPGGEYEGLAHLIIRTPTGFDLRAADVERSKRFQAGVAAAEAKQKATEAKQQEKHYTALTDAVEKLRIWCRATGIAPVDMTVADAKAQVFEGSDISDGVIAAAIDQLKQR